MHRLRQSYHLELSVALYGERVAHHCGIAFYPFALEGNPVENAQIFPCHLVLARQQGALGE